VIQARHQYSLRHYGAFMAIAEEGMDGALERSELHPETLPGRLLLTASVVQRAERTVLMFGHARVPKLTRGFQGRIVPSFLGDVKDHYLFLPDGDLVALPIMRRRHEVSPRWRTSEPVMLPVVHLEELLATSTADTDPANRPRPVESERRLAWLGVEFQPLDDKLARANDVAHLTENGSYGALVSYVYPDSPAADAGFQPGNILIRLTVFGRTKPLEVRDTVRGRWSFDDVLDDLSPSSRRRLPRRPPWPSVETGFNRALSRMGVGIRCIAEVAVDGVLRKRELWIGEGPPHFEGAPHYEAKRLGLTVRDLTYEVRRYYQLGKDAPGVVVAEVERGMPAAVAGVRLYEILSRVNGERMDGVAAFEAATAEGGEVRLTIRGIARERIVKLRALPAHR